MTESTLEKLNLNESIHNLDFLTPTECDQVISTIIELKKYWIHEQAKIPIPFYTLGSGSYFHKSPDSNQLKEQYHTLRKKYNPLLKKHLGWLYQNLADTLVRHLNALTCYPDQLALPGFHIFLAHESLKESLAPLHFDLQHHLHQWQDADFNKSFSFTLALSLPQSGGGMNIWDLHYKETLGLSSEEFQDLIKVRKKHYYPYQIGKLAIHSGYFCHQIACSQTIQPDDRRITLQGHGTFDRGRWHLYW